MWAWWVGLAMADQGTWAFPTGLHVVFYPDDRYPVANIALVISAGNAASGADRPDLAHLVEHLAFRADVGDESLTGVFNEAGCAANAFTKVESTAYFARCPSASAEVAIAGLLGLLDGGLAGISEADVADEATIVEREYAMRTATRQTYAILQSLYGAKHPYGGGGRPQPGASPPTLAQVRAFHAAHYVPAHAVLVVTGGITRAELARGLMARPGLLATGATAASLRTYPAADLRVFGFEEPAPWLPDPRDPTRPLPLSATRAPKRWVDRSEPSPPASRYTQIDVAETEPSWWVAWRLPPANYLDYFRYAAAGQAAAFELGDVAGHDLTSSCEVLHGRLNSTLVCQVTGDLAAAEAAGLEARLVKAMARPWTLHLEQRVQAQFRDDSQQINLERRERDAGGTDTAVEAGEHFLFTDNAVYFTDKYTRMQFDQVWYLGLRDVWLRPEWATVLVSRPYGALAVAGVGEVDDARVPPLDAIRPDPSPLWNVRHAETLENGHQLLMIEDHGTFGRVEVAYAAPPGTSGEAVRAAALYVQRPKRFRGREVWSNVPRVYAAPRTAVLHMGMTPGGAGDWVDDFAFLIESHAEGGAVRYPAEAADRRLERIVAAWRFPQYWADQAFLDALGGDDDVVGSSVAELEASRPGGVAARAAVFDPRYAVTLVVGPYAPRDLVEPIAKRFGTGAPGPVRPAVSPRAPVLADSVELYAPLADTGLAEVSARCAVDVREGTGARRVAVARVAGVLVRYGAISVLRAQRGAAYASGATVSAPGDGDVWVARAGTLVAPGDVVGAIEALEAAFEAAARPSADDLRSAVEVARAELRPGSTLEARAVLQDLIAEGVTVDEIVGLDGAFAAITAADVATALAPCLAGLRIAIVAPQAAVRPALQAAGLDPVVVPWRTLQGARLGALPPKLAAEERGWQARHPTR